LVFNSKIHNPSRKGDPAELFGILEATNTTIQFGLAIGFKGSLAYQKVFEDLKEYRFTASWTTSYDSGARAIIKPSAEKADWHGLAEAFVSKAREVEAQMRTMVRTMFSLRNKGGIVNRS
jgi:hypothetical protein